jgi:hypothetical protein
VPLGLHLPYWHKRYPVICHQYLGRVRNRILVWFKENDWGPWTVSDREVDFGGLSNKDFESDPPRHETETSKDTCLPDGTRCLSRRLETTGEVRYFVHRVETMNQAKNLVSSLDYPPGNRLEERTPYYRRFLWGKWNGTLVELGDYGDIQVFRYGLQ